MFSYRTILTSKRLSSLLFGAFLLAVPGVASATCGSSNCFLVTGTGEGVLEPNQGVVDLSYRYIPQDQKHRGSSNTGEVLVPRVDFENGVLIPNHHREHRTINMLTQLDVSYGITHRLTLALAIPFSNRRLHEHDDEVDLAATPPALGVFTNNDGTDGFGDVAVSARYSVHAGSRDLIVPGVGLKLPTGVYKLRDGEGRINEPSLMPGTGSWDGLFSLFGSYQLVPHVLDGFVAASYRLTTKNDLDYERGDTTVFSGGVSAVATETITVSGQINAVLQGRDTFKGQDVPSTGSTFIFLTPGVRLKIADTTSVYTLVQVPLWEDVNEVNLVPQYGLQLGVTHSF